MKVCLTVIFLIILVFIFRIKILQKIKNKNGWHEPPNNNYFAIPSIKVVNVICFFSVLLCMALGLFFFEFYYASPEFMDEITWYTMIGCIAIFGLYYGLMLHTQYFYFIFGDGYIEFRLTIGKTNAIRILLKDIKAINKDNSKYSIIMKDGKNHYIYFRVLKFLIGSELLKSKLADIVKI